MQSTGQKVLIYGTRASPLSLQLSRSLNLRLTAANVFSLDTEITRSKNRLLPMTDKKFQCNELSDMTSPDEFHRILD